MSPDDGFLEAFRRGRQHDQQRRSATKPVAPTNRSEPAEPDDLDTLIEARRAEAIRRAQAEQQASQAPPASRPSATRHAPAIAPSSRPPVTAPSTHETPALRRNASRPAAPARSRVREARPSAATITLDHTQRQAPGGTGIVVRTLNIPSGLMRRLRLLQVARDQDYIDLIAEAVRDHAADVPVADHAVKRRSRVRGEKVTLKIPRPLDRTIDDLAIARQLNRSAFVSAVIERLVAAVPPEISGWGRS